MSDIRITPGSSIMNFTSSLNYVETLKQDASGSLNLYGSGSLGRTEIFSIDGNNGRLFTVSDDLSDSLFSVNTIAGLPVIEAFANNTVVMGQYGTNALVVSGSNVGIGTASPSEKLDVNGYVKATGFKTLSGTSSQFLKADGSVDSNTYALANGTNATDNWSNTSSGLSLNPSLAGKTLNASGQTVYLRDATYGQISGIVQDSTNSPETGQWSNRLKTLHNDSAGYFTELAQSFTGTEGVWHRRNSAGTISSWKRLYDDSIWSVASLSYSGSTLTLTINGISKTATINAGTSYTLPTASATVLGGVKIGSGISIDGNGVISANTSIPGNANYLPKFSGYGTLEHSIIYDNGTNVGIGTEPSPNHKLHVNGAIVASSFFESSLRKYKTNIKKFDKSGIDLVDILEIVTFDRIDSDVNSKIGIIADDTPEEFLSEDKCAVDLYKTVFIQAKAIQELKTEINNLKKYNQ